MSAASSFSNSFGGPCAPPGQLRPFNRTNRRTQMLTVMAAEARTGRGEAAAAGITGEPAGVVEEVLEGDKLLNKAVLVENSPAAGATAWRIGSGSAFEKGKAAAEEESEGGAADVEAEEVVVVKASAADVDAALTKRKTELLMRNLVGNPRMLGLVASRLRHKVAMGKMNTEVKPGVEEVPNRENTVTVGDLLGILGEHSSNGGEHLSYQIIPEADVYSKPPNVLVQEFPGRCTLWKDKHEKTTTVWLFLDRSGGKRRCRMVGGGSGREEYSKWHSDHSPKPIEEFPWACKTQYYYRINCSKAKPKGERTGWCMTEFSLTNQQGGAYLVCKVYQLNRSHPETPTADISFPGEETPTIEQGHREAMKEDGESAVESRGHLSLPMRNLLVQATVKAKSCSVDWREVCKISEFVCFTTQLHSTIDELLLDRSIVSELLIKLQVLLQSVAITKELTLKAQNEIVSSGDYMMKTIQSAVLDERVKRQQKETIALSRIGGAANVQDQLSKRASQKQVTDVPLLMRDSAGSEQVHYRASAEAGVLSIVKGAENKRPIPVNTSAASSSGVKRKANQEHPEAPQRMQERADTGTDCQEEIAGPRVQSEQQGLAEVVEGCSGPRNAMDGPEDPPITNQERAVMENEPMTMESDMINDGVDKGGEQAIPAYAPGAVTEEDDGQGSRTAGPEESERRFSTNNIVTPVRVDNVDDPKEISGEILGEGFQIEPVRGDEGRDSTRLRIDMALMNGADGDGDYARRSPARTPLEGNDCLQMRTDDEVDEYPQNSQKNNECLHSTSEEKRFAEEIEALLIHFSGSPAPFELVFD